MRISAIFLVLFLFISSAVIRAQPAVKRDDTASQELTLNDCIKYALRNQPAVNQSRIDEAIARANNAIAFSAWLPQVSGMANVQHYFQRPTVFSTINNSLSSFTSGVYDYSIPQLAASQTIFSTDVLLAARASKLNTQAARENTTNTKISLVSSVSVAFYDLLLSIEQTKVYREDTARLKKNRDDAYNRFLSGIVDKVDYKQATITLNNSMAQLKTAVENVGAKYATLGQLMGYPADRSFKVKFDTAKMMQEIYMDTLEPLRFEKRIEYQQLQTAKRLQHETTAYYQLGFLPSLSAYYDYYEEFQSNKFSDLYGTAYPYSLLGLQLNVPIFSGFRRNENVHKAKLQEERTDWDIVNVELQIFSQYKQSLANYKSNLYYLHAQGENVEMAREVYNVVKLQYNEGVKAYLDLIIAESDLQTSEINYLNALFHLLESKIDLQRAMGDIAVDY